MAGSLRATGTIPAVGAFALLTVSLHNSELTCETRGNPIPHLGGRSAAQLARDETASMSKEQEQHRSYLFTLRLWPEALGDDRTEWRGQVQYVTSGEMRYFRDWSTLVAFLLEVLPKVDVLDN